jgi:hypothetical protein
MSITPIEIEYFIDQFALTGAALGAAPVDAQLAKDYCTHLFAYRCSPPTSILKDVPREPQAICNDITCPLAAGANCSSADGYNGTSLEPAPAGSSSSSTPSQSHSPTSSKSIACVMSVPSISTRVGIGISIITAVAI